jgi:hypothetical protein
MSVRYEIEHTLKSRLVFDALNIVSVDGVDAGERARPGGLERLLPVEGPIGVVVEEAARHPD